MIKMFGSLIRKASIRLVLRYSWFFVINTTRQDLISRDLFWKSINILIEGHIFRNINKPHTVYDCNIYNSIFKEYARFKVCIFCDYYWDLAVVYWSDIGLTKWNFTLVISWPIITLNFSTGVTKD